LICDARKFSRWWSFGSMWRDFLLDREQVLINVRRDAGDVHAEGFDGFGHC